MDYIDELDKALSYIEEHLTECLDLDIISSQVNISSFHFHRIFKAVVHETIMEYVRTRRLTIALEELVNTDHRIIEIAMSIGFESQESFTRAFKTYFGITPGKVRKVGSIRNHNGRPAFSVRVLRDLRLIERTQPEIVHLSQLKMVGLSGHMDLDSNISDNLAPSIWEKFSCRIHEIHHVIANQTYGVERYPEGYGPSNNIFEYVAACQVTEFETIPQGMIAFELPERSYAVYHYKGVVGPDTMTQIFANIYGQWLLNLPYELYSDFDFEFYDENFNPDDPEGYMKVYIPIKI